MPYFSMAKIALKWAFKKPATCNYPFSPRVVIPRSRGHLHFTKENCTYCTVCAKKCPTKALTVNRAGKKWTIDRLLCITCGYCVEICPKKALEIGTNHSAPAITRDAEVY